MELRPEPSDVPLEARVVLSAYDNFIYGLGLGVGTEEPLQKDQAQIIDFPNKENGATDSGDMKSGDW